MHRQRPANRGTTLRHKFALTSQPWTKMIGRPCPHSWKRSGPWASAISVAGPSSTERHAYAGMRSVVLGRSLMCASWLALQTLSLQIQTLGLYVNMDEDGDIPYC